MSDNEKRRELLLMHYFDDMLFKDIALRHKVRDVMSLRSLAVHLASQTATLITFKRLANIFSLSTDTVRAYCSYLQEAFFISCLQYFSLKAAQRTRNPQKIHTKALMIKK